MRPEIRAVRRYIDRNIADDPDSLRRGVVPQLFPLPRELKLQILIIADLILHLFRPGLYRLRFIVAYIRLPAAQSDPSVRFFDRHEEGVIAQPEFVFLFKGRELRRLLVAASLIGLPQKIPAPEVELAVVDFPAVTEICGVALLLCQKSLCDQVLETDQVRISRESREGLIRGIPVSRRA